ncbi:MAG: hypothetical protein Q8O89_01325 [Nanoarchaeota archaeon]|nr:hypothetical protein [Nanoarchaeota archaeon]
MNDLSQIEQLLEGLSDYHINFNGDLIKIQMRLYGVKSCIENKKDLQEKNMQLIESLQNLNNHFNKDCYNNPQPFLKEGIQKIKEEYKPLEELINSYVADPSKDESGLAILEQMENSIGKLSIKISKEYAQSFLTVVADIVDIYEQKGGSIKQVAQTIKEGDNKYTLNHHWKMLCHSQITGREFMEEQKEYLERTNVLYPEFLKK